MWWHSSGARHVLTSGHCMKTNMRCVVNGDTRTKKNLRKHRSRRVEKKIRHPNYNATTWEYDYPLLKLKTKVDINPVEAT